MPCRETDVSDDNTPTLKIDVFNVISKKIQNSGISWKILSRSWRKLAGYHLEGVYEDKEGQQMYLKNQVFESDVRMKYQSFGKRFVG